MTVRLLVDECFPKSLARALASHGHDVTWATLVCRSALDEVVLATATAECRIVVTEDRDYGALIFRDGFPAFGVIVVHGSEYPGGIKASAVEIAAVIHALDGQLAGVLTTITPGRTRQRRLGSTP